MGHACWCGFMWLRWCAPIQPVAVSRDLDTGGDERRGRRKAGARGESRWAAGRTGSEALALRLQRSAGNRAVSGLIQAQSVQTVARLRHTDQWIKDSTILRI